MVLPTPRYQVRPSASLTLLYDHRDELAGLTRSLVQELPPLAKLTDLERTSCAEGSPMLFTLPPLVTKGLAPASSKSRTTASLPPLAAQIKG
jgi:hypothetical protein